MSTRELCCSKSTCPLAARSMLTSFLARLSASSPVTQPHWNFCQRGGGNKSIISSNGNKVSRGRRSLSLTNGASNVISRDIEITDFNTRYSGAKAQWSLRSRGTMIGGLLGANCLWIGIFINAHYDGCRITIPTCIIVYFQHRSGTRGIMMYSIFRPWEYIFRRFGSCSKARHLARTESMAELRLTWVTITV